MVRVSIIAAMAENRTIGLNNNIPWHISEDFKYFKRITMGKPMVMGRKTFESLPGILPGRPHLVISRSGFAKDGVESFTSLESAIKSGKKMAAKESLDEIFIIGGANVYEQSLKLADRLYLTEIHQSYDGDAFFPEFDQDGWKETSRDRHDDDPDYSFVVYEKI